MTVISGNVPKASERVQVGSVEADKEDKESVS